VAHPALGLHAPEEPAVQYLEPVRILDSVLERSLPGARRFEIDFQVLIVQYFQRVPRLVQLPIFDTFVLCDISEKRLYHVEGSLPERKPVKEPFKRLGPEDVIVAFLFRNI
jgi:hypothetical protein